MRARFILVVCAVAASVMASSAPPQENALETPDLTPCQILEAGKQHDGRMIRVRSRILFGFERFVLDTMSCPGSEEYVWLEYGSGPKDQPTVWCCGDLTPTDPLRLVQDKEFKKFHRLLTATRKMSGHCEYGCPSNEVTATIIGRLDVGGPVESDTNPGQMICCAGFGHFGMAPMRIVIQSVSDVTAKRVFPPAPKWRRFTEGDLRGFLRSPTEHMLNYLDTPITVRTVEGVITDPAGLPFQSGYVAFEIQGKEYCKEVCSVGVDDNGRFRIRSVPEGEYQFKATANGFQSVIGTLVVSKKAPRSARIKIKLEFGV